MFIKPDWPAPETVKAVTSTRDGGVSVAPFDSFNLGLHVDDEANAVLHNRELLKKQLSLQQDPVWLTQTHSTTIIEATPATALQAADASFTQHKNLTCAVLTADCLPVLMCDKAGTTVAAVHAGWRGLMNGIVEKTIAALPCKPKDVLVWLGPAIGPEAFEVGVDVYDSFTSQDPQADAAFIQTEATHWHFNIVTEAKRRLQTVGVIEVYGGDRCTFTEKEHFFSYRRDGVTGRMGSLVWITA